MNGPSQSTERLDPAKTGILLAKLTVSQWQGITKLYDDIVGGAATFYLSRDLEHAQNNLDKLNTTLAREASADYRVGSRLTTHSKLLVELEQAANPRVREPVVTFSFHANLDPSERAAKAKEVGEMVSKFKVAVMNFLKAERLAVAVK